MNEGSGIPVLFGDNLAISIMALILDEVREAITIGTISSATKDTSRISIPNNAPPIGELNVAAIAADNPLITTIRIFLPCNPTSLAIAELKPVFEKTSADK